MPSKKAKKRMRITALLENTTARSDMKTEHGLSLYIETTRHRILFDMGQTSFFHENAVTLGIDLAKVDVAILSHGHYDHGGGLGTFLAINDHAPVYIRKDAFLPHYNGTEKYIGLDPSIAKDPRIVFTDDICRLDDTLELFSCNEKERRHAPIPHGLTEKTNGAYITDDFLHEQYLLIRENGKRVLLSGCSHKGILNIADWFSPDVLVGGFHFSKLPLDGFLTDAAKTLSAHPTEFYTCHCTGTKQFSHMQSHMQNLRALSCGETITV